MRSIGWQTEDRQTFQHDLGVAVTEEKQKIKRHIYKREISGLKVEL